jgi:hypothetical protein
MKAMRPLIENVERPLALFLLAVVLASIIFLGWAYWRDNNLAKGFDKIADGATRQDVVRLLGKPKKVEIAGSFLGRFNSLRSRAVQPNTCTLRRLLSTILNTTSSDLTAAGTSLVKIHCHLLEPVTPSTLISLSSRQEALVRFRDKPGVESNRVAPLTAAM